MAILELNGCGSRKEYKRLEENARVLKVVSFAYETRMWICAPKRRH